MERGVGYDDSRKDATDNDTVDEGDFSADFDFLDSDFEISAEESYVPASERSELTSNENLNENFGDFDDFEDTDDFEDFTDDFEESYNPNSDKETPVILNSTKVSDSVTEISLSVDDLATGIFEGDLLEEEDEDLADFNELKAELEESGYTNLENSDFDLLNQLAKRQKIIGSARENVNLYVNSCLETFASVYGSLSTSKATLDGSTGENAEYLRDNVSRGIETPAYIAAEKIATSLLTIRKSSEATVDVTADEVFQYMLDTNVNMEDAEADELKAYLSQIIPKIVAYNVSVSKKEERSKLSRKHSTDILLRKQKELFSYVSQHVDKISYIKNVYVDNDCYKVKCTECGESVELHSVPVTVIMFVSSRANSAGNSERFFLHLPVRCSCGAMMIMTKQEYEAIDSAVMENYKIHNATTSRSSVLASAIQQVSQLCSGASSLIIEPPVACLKDAVPSLIREYSEDGGTEDTTELQRIDSPLAVMLIDDNEFMDAVDRFKKRLSTYKRRVPIAVVENSEADGQSDRGFFRDEVLGSENSFEREVFSSGAWVKRALPHRQLVVLILRALSKSYEEEKSKALFSFVYHAQENPILNDCLDYSEIIDLEQTLLLLNGLTEKTIPYLEQNRKANLVSLWASVNTLYGLACNYNKTEDERILELLSNVAFIEKSLRERRERREFALRFLDSHKDAFGYLKIINVSNVKISDFDNYVCDRESWDLIDVITDLMLINNYAGDYYEVWKTYKVLDKGDLDKQLNQGTGKVGLLNSIKKKLDVFLTSYGLPSYLPKNLDAVVEPVVELHAAIRKCCTQVLNYWGCKSIYVVAKYPDLVSEFSELSYSERERLVDFVGKDSECWELLCGKELTKENFVEVIFGCSYEKWSQMPYWIRKLRRPDIYENDWVINLDIQYEQQLDELSEDDLLFARKTEGLIPLEFVTDSDRIFAVKDSVTNWEKVAVVIAEGGLELVEGLTGEVDVFNGLDKFYPIKLLIKLKMSGCDRLLESLPKEKCEADCLLLQERFWSQCDFSSFSVLPKKMFESWDGYIPLGIIYNADNFEKLKPMTAGECEYCTQTKTLDLPEWIRNDYSIVEVRNLIFAHSEGKFKQYRERFKCDDALCAKLLSYNYCWDEESVDSAEIVLKYQLKKPLSEEVNNIFKQEFRYTDDIADRFHGDYKFILELVKTGALEKIARFYRSVYYCAYGDLSVARILAFLNGEQYWVDSGLLLQGHRVATHLDLLEAIELSLEAFSDCTKSSLLFLNLLDGNRIKENGRVGILLNKTDGSIVKFFDGDSVENVILGISGAPRQVILCNEKLCYFDYAQVGNLGK